MKLEKFVFALFAVAFLSCSSDDLSDKEDLQIVDEITKTNTIADEVAKALIGKWQLVREGDKDFSTSGIYIEFDAEKNVICEYSVGTENYHKVSNNVIFEDDWTSTENKLTGHIDFPLSIEETRFLCSVEGEQLVLLPDCGMYYVMDPTKYFVKVK